MPQREVLMQVWQSPVLALGVVGVLWAVVYVTLYRLVPAEAVPKCLEKRMRRTRDWVPYIFVVSALLAVWGAATGH